VRRLPRDVNIDKIASYTLRSGVLLSVSFIIVGIILIFVKGEASGYNISQVSDFHNMTINSKIISLSFSGIGAGLAHLDGFYFITVGLWVLIFTPISVVVLSIVTFVAEENRLYLIMAIIVLFNLFFAMLVIPRLM
jgi:uncharacterized membrane protein